MIVHGTKEESKEIRWIQKAAARDTSRPILTAVFCNGDMVATADGYRMHAIPKPECLKDVHGAIHAKVPAGDFVAETSEQDGTIPDLAVVMPSNEPVCAIAVKAEYLREALEGQESVVLDIRQPHDPIEILSTSQCEHPRYALVMPINLGHDPDKTNLVDGLAWHWRPFQKGVK